MKFTNLSTYQFLTDEKLFGSINPRAESWRSWNVVFKGSSGEPLTKSEAKVWREITGRKPPRKGFSPSIEVDLVGRQGGKSLSAARRVLKEAFTGNYQQYLVPGERAYVVVVSVNLRSTRVVMDYLKGCLEASPHLAQEVEHKTKTEIYLKNRITLAAYPSSNISVRGLRVCVLILDEGAFFRSEGSVTDLEVFRSIRPAMVGCGVFFFFHNYFSLVLFTFSYLYITTFDEFFKNVSCRPCSFEISPVLLIS